MDAGPAAPSRGEVMVPGLAQDQFESTVSRMSAAARQELYFRRTEKIEELIAKVEAVTLAEVDAEARRVLDGRALSVSVVGNVGRYTVSAAELAGAL